jgi:hypothetical protein
MGITDYVPDCCQLALFPHIILFVAIVASIVPENKYHKYQSQARIAFHAIFGFLLFVVPSVLTGPKVRKFL